MERITGDARTSAGNGEALSRIQMHAGAGHRDDNSGTGTDTEGEGRFHHLKDRLGSATHDLASSLDRSGLLRTIRDNPLASVGVAFTAGLAMALSSAAGDRHWAVERVRRQLRTAVIAGLAAAFADEIKDLVEGNEGLGALVHSFLSDDDEERDARS